MASDWQWPGARWWKCDFHMHTPASYDFQRRSDVTAEEWIAAARAAEIDAVAITDHNTGAFVQVAKESAGAAGRELAVFPGVELTTSPGIHLLVLFPRDRDGDAVTALLGKCDIPDDRRGHPDAVTQCSFIQAVDWAHERGAICIAAHVDDTKGLIKELVTATPADDGPDYSGCQALQQALKSEHLAALEANIGDAKLLAFADGSKTDYRRSLGRLPMLTFSDSHSLEQIGIRFTWLKMTTPTIEGVRLALLDGDDQSVRIGAAVATNPNVHGANVIESIEIRDARYIGRGQAFVLRFNPWLNAIIGGRGTGKSTVIELLRTVAGRRDEIPLSLRDEFGKYARLYQTREDNGLLSTNAQLSLVYRKGEARFRVQWSKAEGAGPILEDHGHEEWHEVDGDIRQRFPVRIYSQKQIFELAREPLALLRIIDDAELVDAVAWNEGWREEEAVFLSHRAKVRELEAGLLDESRLRGELDDVTRKLAVFENAGHADVLREYQTRRRQRRAVEKWESAWADFGAKCRDFSATVDVGELEPDLFSSTDERDLEFLEATAEVQERLGRVSEQIARLGEEADRVAQDWETTRDASGWQTAVSQAVDAYDQLKAKLEEEDAGDPNEYGRLVEERQRLEEKLAGFERRRSVIAETKELATQSLERLAAMRRDLTERRAAFLHSVIGTNPYVRIDVRAFGAREMVEVDLRKLLGRESGGFEKDIGSSDEPDGLVGLVYSAPSVEEGVQQIKARIRAIVAGGPDLANVRDKRFATHLAGLPPENHDRLECWFPEDSLDVRYSTSSDGNNFRSIHEGSPGQKTAALLAFLLSYGTEPIVLDQPEDDLDNHLIYGLIVTQLKRIKSERQIIVVTHNANIVVNGDAEYVAALDARGGQTRVVCDGGLQQESVRETICEIMEGGEEALEARYRRIGGRRMAGG